MLDSAIKKLAEIGIMLKCSSLDINVYKKIIEDIRKKQINSRRLKEIRRERVLP